MVPKLQVQVVKKAISNISDFKMWDSASMKKLEAFRKIITCQINNSDFKLWDSTSMEVRGS